MKRRRIKMCWTCCDQCHAEHRTRLAARLHHWWLRLTDWDEWRGDLDGRMVMLTKHLVHWHGYRVDIHKMVAADRAGCFHTHPAKAWRLVLWGGYTEQVLRGADDRIQIDFQRWGPGRAGVVRPELAHRIAWLLNGRSSYSLWVRSPKTHDVQLVGNGWGPQ